jgi:excisionase family DNA binding protein
MKPTRTELPAENSLFEGLKQLVKEAVREELKETFIEQREKREKLLLDIEEAAQLLNVPKTWLASMAREGKIKSLKLGHYVRFVRADLEGFIQNVKGTGTMDDLQCGAVQVEQQEK